MPVEADVVAARVARQHAQHVLAQPFGFAEGALEGVDRGRREFDQARHAGGALGIGGGARHAPFLHFVEPVTQGLDERLAPLAVGEQIVFEKRVAPHHPDVAEDLEEHACRAAGDALAAQGLQDRPGLLAQQPDHDLAVGQRGVVVRDFAQTRVHHPLRARFERQF